MKRAKVTIGIPAYNEEENIKFLLKGLLTQNLQTVQVEEIIVVSDGSDDQTVKKIKSIKSPKIKVIENKVRLGGRVAQNRIISTANSEILILLDADVIPFGKNFIEKIVGPILKDPKVGMTGADTISVKPTSIFERIISESHNLKREIYRKINNGDNLYNCHGRARAFRKELYKQIKWPADCPEDAFSYFVCKKKNFKFKFVSGAKILFRSPSTIGDHLNQSTRFLNGRKQLESYFSPEIIKESYFIPNKFLIPSVIKFLAKKPFLISTYLIVYLYSKTQSILRKDYESIWEISKSSKKVIYEKTV